MRLRITIAMLEIRNRETLQSKVNICKSDVKIGDYADSLVSIPSSYGVITCAYILIIAKIVTYYTYLHKHSKKYIKIVKIHHSILD